MFGIFHRSNSNQSGEFQDREQAEIYNQTGVFQITNIKHNIAPEGWDTTIEAGFRIVETNKEPPKK